MSTFFTNINCFNNTMNLDIGEITGINNDIISRKVTN